MLTRYALITLLLLWLGIETFIWVATRKRLANSENHDRGSLWTVVVVIAASITAAFFLRNLVGGVMGTSPSRRYVIAIVLIVWGLVVRVWAITTLGAFFTSKVTILRAHRIVRRGPYRRIRHPSYSGALLAFVGLGIAFGNWVSLAVLLAPIALVLLYRIHIEEHCMREYFGQEYLDYHETTKRLIPWLF